MKYFLRIEGINLDSFVYDTNDLSTVRGGGLLMLELAERTKILLSDFSCETISVGASWGLFKVDLDEKIKLKAFLTDINRQLTKEPFNYQDKNGNLQTLTPWQHATWVIDLTKAAIKFKTSRDQAHALNRWQQMQSLSLTVPEQESHQPDIKKAVCDFDMVRPASKKWLYKEEKAISHHVLNRRIYGREQKQDFYEKETGIKGLKFSQDLSQLTGHDDRGCTKDIVGNIEGKMAVIYLDGNSFGKTQRDLCKEEWEQQEFNNLVKDGQKVFLTNLLNTIKDNPYWQNSLHDNRLRLETLLWGGDEIMWVVPAWQGWWLLATFFQETETKAWQFKGKQLTHAAGLVFCKHNAPIHRIKNIAHDLAEMVKDKKKKNAGRVAYQVLESFDQVGNNLEKFCDVRCPGEVTSEQLIVDGGNMSAVAENIKSLKSKPDFSKRKLNQIVHALYDIDADKVEALAESSGLAGMPEIIALKNDLGDPAHWLHLLELWDYIGTEDN